MALNWFLWGMFAYSGIIILNRFVSKLLGFKKIKPDFIICTPTLESKRIHLAVTCAMLLGLGIYTMKLKSIWQGSLVLGLIPIFCIFLRDCFVIPKT